MEKRELVIIGAGPAGLSAAIYGKRAGLDTLVLEKGRPGGQVLITSKIENYPGILDGTGSGLADAFRTHAEHFKAEFRTASVQKLEVRDGEKIITLKDGSEIAAGAVIVASGASFRKQGCPGESTYTGMGVSYCAVCDAAFFEELEVAVIGGGNTAVEEALYLSNIASEVHLIHRRDGFRAEKILIKRLMDKVENGNIILHTNRTLEEVTGDQMGVTGVRLRDTQNSDNIESLDVAGLFVAIGHSPNTAIFEGQLELENGYIKVQSGIHGNATQTSIPGVFAAGDVMDHIYRQAITSAGTGCMAALDAERYLDGLADAK